MKNNRIIRAYDSINPSPADKAKMLDAILAEAKLEEPVGKQRKKKEPIVYTAKAPQPRRSSNFSAIAAGILLLLVSGLILMQMIRQPESISYMDPVNLGTPYDEVLTKYKAALEEGWSAQQCQIEDICGHVMTTNYSALDVSYAMEDLDGNGREELIITNGQGLVWDLYTLLEDDTPVHVHCQEDGWPVYRLYENGVICAEEFDSGKIYEYYVYRDGAFTGPEVVICQNSGMFTYEAAGEEPYFITGAEAGAKMTEYKLQELDCISLLTLVSNEVAEKYLFGSNTGYAEILAKYNQAIAEGWSKEQCANEGISLRMQVGNDVSKAGYVFLDLDDDGREEFIIAEESTDRTDNIWVLYTTLEDGTPIQLWVDEMTGGQCRLHEGNVISISDSYKDELEQTFYDLQDGKLVMREMLQWEDEDTVFHTDAEGNTRQVTSREGQSISYAYENQKLNLTWLANDPDYLRDTDNVEQYTPVLEKYRTALIEDWSQYLCMEADISPALYPLYSVREDLGWCLLDIDQNGMSELIISDGDYIYDIYTLLSSDGAPGHLISKTEDLHYFLEEDGTIECQRTENGVLYWTDYQLSGEDLIVKSVMSLDFNSGAYRYGLSEQGLQPLSSVKAQEYIDGSRSRQLNLTPFIESPDHPVEEMQLYDPLLSIYRQAIAEGWKPGDCAEKGISLMVGYYGDLVHDLGYKLLDLDGNGFEELIITDGTNIYDMYTIIEDEGICPLHLFTAMERIEYFLTTDWRIYNLGSGSASVSYYMLYQLNGLQLDLDEGYMMDYETNPSSPWYYYDGENRGDPCPHAAAAIDAIHFQNIPFTPFE